MLSDKVWRDGMARLCACFPAASKNLSEEDIAVRDLAYHDAIAPLFGDAEEAKRARAWMLCEAAWLAAVVDVTRSWEYPFALPPPQDLIEACRAADARLRPNPERRTAEEIEAGKREAAKGLALIESEMAKRGMPPLQRARTWPELPASEEPCVVVLSDERREELRKLAERVVEAIEK